MSANTGIISVLTGGCNGGSFVTDVTNAESHDADEPVRRSNGTLFFGEFGILAAPLDTRVVDLLSSLVSLKCRSMHCRLFDRAQNCSAPLSEPALPVFPSPVYVLMLDALWRLLTAVKCLGDQQAALLGQNCLRPGETKSTCVALI